MQAKFKRVVALTLCLITIFSLTSCKKEDPNADPLLSETKETLVDMVNSLNQQIIDDATEIDRLNEKLTEVQSEQKPTPGITEMSDETGRLTFYSVDGAIQLPTELIYPGSEEASNTSKINISDSVSVIPTSNWGVKILGSRLDMTHINGIYGQISVGYLSKDARKAVEVASSPNKLGEYLEGYLDESFKDMQVNTKKYSRLFLNDTQYGVDATITTFVDEEDATIRCGILGYGEISLQYCFYYMGKDDAIYNEAITSLIRTITILNQQLSVSN